MSGYSEGGLFPADCARGGRVPTAATLSERAATHGSFSDNGHHAQALKNLIHASKGWVLAAPRQREALDMIASKLARIMSGQPDFPDHWLDISGYATLAGDPEIQS